METCGDDFKRENINTHLTMVKIALHSQVRFPCLFIYLFFVSVFSEKLRAMLMILEWKLCGKFGVLKDKEGKNVTTISCRLIISSYELLSKVIS